jgi:uncharacterized damage-inducible protein DinB
LKTKSWFTTVTVIAASVLLISFALPDANASPMRGAAQVAPAQVYGKLLSNLENEIVAAAQAMPADKFDFAPTAGNFEGVRTFGQQIKHIAEANYHMLSGFGVQPGVDPKTIDGLTSKDDIVKALQDSFAFVHKVIDTMTPQNAFAAIDARQSTRAGSVAMVLVHANDHYGQMVEYLRMNGIIPPASRR